MSVAAPERAGLIGDQEPRIRSVPDYGASAGDAAVDFAAKAGLILDPWQQLVLRDALGERAVGKWAAFEVGLIVSRQNGKGSILEARELAGLFLFREELILHSAHEFKTAQEAFRRVRDLIDGNRSFRRQVKRITNNTFEVGIELLGGQRLKFVARSGGSGRGFSGDCVILDEAFNLPDTAIDALMPTMSARPNPQMWYTSSAPDKKLARCEPLARLRRRGMAGGDPSLAFFEWSAEICTDECAKGCDKHRDDPSDRRIWAKANPGLGIRITADHVAREFASMGHDGFLRERLGIGDYPAETADRWAVISEHVYRALEDPVSKAGERVAFAIDATPGGTHAAILVAGFREDGLGHIEVVAHGRGTSWVVDRAAGLGERWGPVAWVVDPRGPAGFLITELEERGVEVTRTSAGDVATATDAFIAACGVADGDEAKLRVVPNSALEAAVAGAGTRTLGDGRKWDRRSPDVDISPLVGGTLAWWGLTAATEEENAMPLVVWR